MTPTRKTNGIKAMAASLAFLMLVMPATPWNPSQNAYAQEPSAQEPVPPQDEPLPSKEFISSEEEPLVSESTMTDPAFSTDPDSPSIFEATTDDADSVTPPPPEELNLNESPVVVASFPFGPVASNDTQPALPYTAFDEAVRYDGQRRDVFDFSAQFSQGPVDNVSTSLWFKYDLGATQNLEWTTLAGTTKGLFGSRPDSAGNVYASYDSGDLYNPDGTPNLVIVEPTDDPTPEPTGSPDTKESLDPKPIDEIEVETKVDVLPAIKEDMGRILYDTALISRTKTEVAGDLSTDGTKEIVYKNPVSGTEPTPGIEDSPVPDETFFGDGTPTPEASLSLEAIAEPTDPVPGTNAGIERGGSAVMAEGGGTPPFTPAGPPDEHGITRPVIYATPDSSAGETSAPRNPAEESPASDPSLGNSEASSTGTGDPSGIRSSKGINEQDVLQSDTPPPRRVDPRAFLNTEPVVRPQSKAEILQPSREMRSPLADTQAKSPVDQRNIVKVEPVVLDQSEPSTEKMLNPTVKLTPVERELAKQLNEPLEKTDLETKLNIIRSLPLNQASLLQMLGSMNPRAVLELIASILPNDPMYRILIGALVAMGIQINADNSGLVVNADRTPRPAGEPITRDPASFQGNRYRQAQDLASRERRFVDRVARDIRPAPTRQARSSEPRTAPAESLRVARNIPSPSNRGGRG